MSNMSIFSISTNYIWIANEKEAFYNYVANIFQKLIFQNLYPEKDVPCNILQSHTQRNSLECFHKYNIYMMIVRKMKNPKSRVENSYRLWKKIEKDLEIKLDKFDLGEEIRADIGEKSYWYGVKKVPVEEFLPNILLIGSDGGEIAYGINSKCEYIEVPFIPMDEEEVLVIAETFEEFIQYLYKE